MSICNIGNLPEENCVGKILNIICLDQMLKVRRVKTRRNEGLQLISLTLNCWVYHAPDSALLRVCHENVFVKARCFH